MMLTKALVVDDQSENRSVVKAVLARYNMEIIEAENGLVAVEIFLAQEKKAPIDFITMDYQMPLMNGAQALLEIRKKNLRVPVVCISASIQFMRPKVCHLPNLYYLEKPLEPKKLIEIIEEIQLEGK